MDNRGTKRSVLGAGLAATTMLAALAAAPTAFAARQLAPANNQRRENLPGFPTSGTSKAPLAANIVAGVTVNPPFEYPWAVSVVDTTYKPDTNGLVSFEKVSDSLDDSDFSCSRAKYCGGVIINTAPWMMLTAAHCTEPFFEARDKPISDSYPNLRVRAHRHNLATTCEAENCIDLRPVKATWHPKFDKPSKDGSSWLVWDFAVWLLQPVPVKYARPAIQVPELDTGTIPGTQLTMVGYGYTKIDDQGDGIVGPRMQETNVSLIGPGLCEQLDNIPMSASFQCSVPVNNRGGQCRGDSGSPIFKRVKQTVARPCKRQLVGTHMKMQKARGVGDCGTRVVQKTVIVGLNSFGAVDCGSGSYIIGSGQSKIAAAKTWIESVVCKWGGKCAMKAPTQRKTTKKAAVAKKTTRKGRVVSNKTTRKVFGAGKKTTRRKALGAGKKTTRRPLGAGKKTTKRIRKHTTIPKKARKTNAVKGKAITPKA